MDTLNINSGLYMLVMVLFISCAKKETNSNVPLYLFKEVVEFREYALKDIESAKVIFIKKGKIIDGKIISTKQNDSTYYGRIKFESIYDTIYKNDTIKIFINNEIHNFSEITNRYIKHPHGGTRTLIEYKLDNKKCRKGESILHKQHN